MSNANAGTSHQGSISNSPGSLIVQVTGTQVSVAIGDNRVTLRPQPPRAIQTELDVLKARNQAIPFVGRKSTVDDLLAWLDDPRRVSIRTFTGHAGAGKTRLAHELLRQIGQSDRAARWVGGFLWAIDLRHGSPGRVDGPAPSQNGSPHVLMIVDYAAPRAQALRGWVETLARAEFAAEGPKIRLLILEREASRSSGWYHELTLATASSEEIIDLFDPIEPLPLPPIDLVEDRREIITSTIAALNDHLKVQPAPGRVPPAGADAAFDARLADPAWSDPLRLMMAAVLLADAAVSPSAVWSLSRPELALKLAERECDQLEPFDKKSGLLPLLAAFTTMAGRVTFDQALAAAQAFRDQFRSRGFANPPGNETLARSLQARFPAEAASATSGRRTRIGGVEPDIVGEAFVIEVFRRFEFEPADQAAVLAHGLSIATDSPRRDDRNFKNAAVDFVRRCLCDFPNAAEPSAWLDTLIEKGRRGEVWILETLENALPEQSFVLAEKAVQITGALYRIHGQQSPAQDGQSLDKEESAARQARLARLANNLGGRLSELGRREEALAATREAVDLYRRLAAARPDAFEPDLAASLNNLGVLLSDLGRREEALAATREAVDLYRRLAAARPDAFEPNLAMSLNNLGGRFKEMDRPAEAVDAYREACQRILPALRTYPPAFARRAAVYLRDYVGLCQLTGADMDKELIDQIVAILKKLNDGENE